MSDVFISYSTHDKGLIKPLARVIEEAGYSVWWDLHLRGGDEFRDKLVEKIHQARVTIVCWTEASVGSPWVRSEAEIARARGTLLPVRARDLAESEIPPPFGVLHTIAIDDTAAILSSLAAKIELDAATRAEAAKRHLVRRRRRLAALVTVIFAVAAAGIAVAAIPSLRLLLGETARRGWYTLFPCEDREIFIGTGDLARRACIAPSERFRFQDCGECPEMVVIFGGNFEMGSPRGERGRDLDEEIVEVEIPDFAIGRYEVTIGQWQRCVAADACRALPKPAELTGDTFPVGLVTWNDAKGYTAWLSELTDRLYRLPSESEWEYAARAGESAARFWGPHASEACGYANVYDQAHLRSLPGAPARPMSPVEASHPCDDGSPFLAPVGSFKANGWELLDMIGNVWEWVEDCEFPDYRVNPRDGSAYSPPDCRVGMLRGGSFKSPPASARSANRFQGGRDRSSAQPDFGFRVARDIE